MIKYRKIINTLNDKEAYISSDYFVSKGMSSLWKFLENKWIEYYELDMKLEVLK